MSKRKRTRRDWPVVLSEYRASGLSGKQFCEERGITPSLFYRWRNRLAGETGEVEDAGFTELIGRAATDCSSGIRLQVGGGMTICIDRGFDPGTLREVVGALADEPGCATP